MTGLAGAFGAEDKGLVKKMLARLEHRGHAQPEVRTFDALVLGARGVKAGRSFAEREGVHVACDSYLFNRQELAERFCRRGGPAPSDPELLLSMYLEIGVDAFAMLDGAFVATISDNGRLVLARDRYGLKPLYITRGKEVGSFSSEMKSQIIPGDRFAPFPPGKVYLHGRGYKSIRTESSRTRPLKVGGGGRSQLRRLVIDATAACLGREGGFNILLSGGIDSSVVAAAASVVTDRLDTVCVGVDGGVDLDMASKVADRLGTNHKERRYDIDEMLEVLGDVVYAAESFDYPLIRSCIPNYIAAREFKRRSRVTLCGEGGDEIFAGYDYMRDIKTDEGLRLERISLLETGHLTGFQRVDRMTASAGLDGRMPLMSGRVIEFGLALPRDALIGPRQADSKLALRRAFESYLPREVLERRKQRFSDGAGSITALASIADEVISQSEFEREKRKAPRGRIRTKEELLYYRAFKNHFDSSSAVAAVGFTPRP